MYIRQIFLIQIKYRLQSMYNHMVVWATSDISPFYFILLDTDHSLLCYVYPSISLVSLHIYNLYSPPCLIPIIAYKTKNCDKLVFNRNIYLF